MIIETLVVKGLWTLGHTIAAHGLAGKAGLLAWKSIVVNGFAPTVAGVVAAGGGAGVICWTYENAQILHQGLEALYNGNYIQAVEKFARLVKRMNIHVQVLPDAVQNFLIEKAGMSREDAHNIGQSIANLEDQIVRELRYL